MGRRRTWTMAELQKAKKRAESGETWKSIATDFDVTAGTVRKQVRTHLGSVASRPRRPYRKGYEKKLIEAISLRNRESMSWSIIAVKVKWNSSTQALRKAAIRYGEETGVRVDVGFPAVRRTKWDKK